MNPRQPDQGEGRLRKEGEEVVGGVICEAQGGGVAAEEGGPGWRTVEEGVVEEGL